MNAPGTQKASQMPTKGTLSGELLPSVQTLADPPPPRRICLRDMDAIRREMGRVYRDARCGQIESSGAARLVYMLAELRKTYEVSVLERRLAALEHKP